MKGLNVRLLAALIAGGALADAQEFPFTAHNMTFQEARSCPGGYGSYGMVWTKVLEVKKAPKAQSAKPLFGKSQPSSSRPGPDVLFFFDESKGTGKGYDRMAIDLNGNGDLTDDPVHEKLAEGQGESNPDYEQANFGPIEARAEMTRGIWRPRFYAEMYLYNKRELNNYSASEPHPIGQVRIQAGNYLATSVEVNGVKQKFGLVDGNCNFKLGDLATSTKIQRRPNDPGSWYMIPGDYLLRDRDNNGKFERTPTDSDAEIYSSVIYFGGKPFSVQLASDFKTVGFKPFSEPVGELALNDKVTDIILGWQKATDAWEALTPEVVGGKATLPAGTYRISSCSVGAKKSADIWIKARSSDAVEKTFSIAAGQAIKLEAGTPLSVAVTGSKERADQGGESTIMGAARSLFGLGSSKTSFVLRMDLSVVGAAGEKYSGFMMSDSGQVPPPRFQVFDTAGKEIASGNFEYG